MVGSAFNSGGWTIESLTERDERQIIETFFNSTKENFQKLKKFNSLQEFFLREFEFRELIKSGNFDKTIKEMESHIKWTRKRNIVTMTKKELKKKENLHIRKLN